MEIIFIIIVVISAAGGYILGRRSIKVVTLSDTLKANVKRTEKQKLGDGVLQLQNEIIKSGAVKYETPVDGEIKVYLKVVKW